MIHFASRLATPPRRPRARRAVAAVEFAVVLPLIALLVTGTFEVGRAIMVRQALNDAARKGCRTGILPGQANAAITGDVNDVLTENSIAPSDATVAIQVNGQTVDARTAQQKDQLSVKVSLPYAKAAWTPLFFFSNTTLESDTLVMMRQG